MLGSLRQAPFAQGLRAQSTIGSLTGQSPNLLQQAGDSLGRAGQRLDISGFSNPGLSILGQLFGGGLGRLDDWWNSRRGETPAQPTPTTPEVPAGPQYSADLNNPYNNILGSARTPTGMTTFGSMLARQPTL